MRLNFLCHQHRQALVNDPAAARSLWLDARRRLATEMPVPTPRCVRLAGSALEAAGIYLQANPACDGATLHRYADSSLQLVELLVQLRQTRLAIVVVAGSNAMVEKLAREGADTDAAFAVCRRLTLQGMEHIEGAVSPLQGVRRPPQSRPRDVVLH